MKGLINEKKNQGFKKFVPTLKLCVNYCISAKLYLTSQERILQCIVSELVSNM